MHDTPHIRRFERAPNSDSDAVRQSVGSASEGSSAPQANSTSEEHSLPVALPGRRFISPPVDKARVVARPVPRTQANDPREFQLQQLRRRYSPAEVTENNKTSLSFTMFPSDPDFPFEMDGLDCTLHVPMDYPRPGKPYLSIKNKEMGRGYQINVERGFDSLLEKSPQATLLGLLNALDKKLEALLTAPKAETIKILPNTSTARPAEFNVLPSRESSKQPGLIYTQKQKQEAEARREVEISQLQARLGRLPLFSKSADGLSYYIPIQPRQHDDLPVPLQAVKVVKLVVPTLYPLQPCTIELQGVDRDAAMKTEWNFERNVKASSETTLLGHVNHLAQNMHILATTAEQAKRETNDMAELPQSAKVTSDDQPADGRSPLRGEDDRSHIVVIPRPPEWTSIDADGESGDSEYSDSYDSGDEFTDHEEASHTLVSEPEGPERGMSLSFPLLELYGIELLELVSLCVTVKCERCKDTMDINSIRAAHGARSETCKKCARPLRIGFRKELMHNNCIRAGYLDLDGCTISDMLPR